MSSKNVVLVDKEKNQLAPATIAEQVEYSGSNVKRVLEHYIASPETMRKSSATLWSGSVYQKDDTMVLSQSPENFDEIIVQYDDEYRVFPAADFGASPAVLQKLSTRDTIYSDVSLNTEIELYYGELAISRVGASGSVNYKLSRSKAWSWSGESSEPSEIENGTLDITGAITKIIGVKYANDAEVYDLRLGADGEEYDTAGEAVRTLIAKNADEKVPYPTSSGGTVVYGTAGQALLSKGDGTTEWGAGGGGSGILWSRQDINLFQTVLQKIKYSSADAGTIVTQLINSLNAKPTDEGWTMAQIDLLDSLLDYVKYAEANGGEYADQLIDSLKGLIPTYEDADSEEY